MASENVESNNLGAQKGKKTGASRRTWTRAEEAVLIDALKEIIVGGHWRTENGFRPGYLSKLESLLREKMPGTDLKAFPHINSRILTWKKHHGALQVALGDSGSSINLETKIISVGDTAWAKALNKDQSVASMRYKPWHYHADWFEIFGNDNANGSPAEDVVDADVNLQTGTAVPPVGPHEPAASNVVFEDVEIEVDSDVPVGTSKSPSQTSSKKRRRSTSSNKEELVSALDDVFKTSDDRIAAMLRSIDSSSSSADNTQLVYPMLESLPGLSLDDCLDAFDMLSKSEHRVKMFVGLPDQARLRYVHRLIAGDFGP